jgi:hypothetical protein
MAVGSVSHKVGRQGNKGVSSNCEVPIPLLIFSSRQGRVLAGERLILVPTNNLDTSSLGKSPMVVVVLQAGVLRVFNPNSITPLLKWGLVRIKVSMVYGWMGNNLSAIKVSRILIPKVTTISIIKILVRNFALLMKVIIDKGNGYNQGAGFNPDLCYRRPQRPQFYGGCINASAGGGYPGRGRNFRFQVLARQGLGLVRFCARKPWQPRFSNKGFRQQHQWVCV